MRMRGIMDGFGVLRESTPWRKSLQEAEKEAAKLRYSKLQQAQFIDCQDWLPNDLLTKVDRMLMAHGLEGRPPFLDPHVANFALTLPDKLKLHKGRGKHIVRQWLAHNFPEVDPFAKKRGFTVPVGEWIGRRAQILAPFVAHQPGVAEICEPKKVEALFKDLGKKGHFAAWNLLFYAIWHTIHVMKAPLQGGLEDGLAA